MFRSVGASIKLKAKKSMTTIRTGYHLYLHSLSLNFNSFRSLNRKCESLGSSGGATLLQTGAVSPPFSEEGRKIGLKMHGNVSNLKNFLPENYKYVHDKDFAEYESLFFNLRHLYTSSKYVNLNQDWQINF